MCDRLSELRRATSRYASCFDAGALSPSIAQKAVADLSMMEASVQAMKALAAAVAAKADTWRRDGYRSAAEALADETGTSVGAARDVIETGRRLSEQPVVSKAAQSGELSFSQASLIANAVEADPKAERRLIEDARRFSHSKLKDECAATKAQAHPDLEARRKAIHARRYLRSWTDVEGVWHLNAAGNPEEGAQVVAALEPIRNFLFHKARKEGRRESPDAYGFDALVELAKDSLGTHRSAAKTGRGSGTAASRSDKGGGARSKPANGDDGNAGRGRGAPVKLLVRIDLDTFLRGFPVKGETCEVAGYGPVAVSAVQDLLKLGDPFVAAILTKGRRLVGVAHLGRKPTAFQRSALEWLYPTCAVDGCNARARLEMDHTIDWVKTYFTMLDYLGFLCHHHHYLKTHEKWAPVDEDGRYLLVAPEDPRHPRHRKNQSGSNVAPRGSATRGATPTTKTVAKRSARSAVSIAKASTRSRFRPDIHLRRMTT